MKDLCQLMRTQTVYFPNDLGRLDLLEFKRGYTENSALRLAAPDDVGTYFGDRQ